MTTSSLLFLSGAGLPGWIWDDTRAALPEAGDVAPRPFAPDADVDAYARQALEAAHDGPLTIVAHSAGGVIAAQLAMLAPGRVVGVLAVTAVIPKAGHSFVSSMPYPNRLLLPTILRLAGTRPPDTTIRTSLAAGVDTATTDRLINDFTPESRAYFTSCVSAELTAPVRGYVTTSDDAELPIALQHRYATRLRPTFTRTLTSGHLPMLTHPNQLAETITDFHNDID